MKKIILLLVPVVLFTTCKKQNNDQNYLNVEHVSYPGYGLSSYYTYDSKNRLTLSEDFNGVNLVQKTEYVYTNNQVTITKYVSPNLTSPTLSYTSPLTTDGYILNSINNTIYTYNAEGYLINANNDFFGTTINYYYTNGDNTMTVSTEDNISDTTRFYFDTIPDIKNMGLMVFGKPNTHLLIGSTSATESFTYENELDSQKRLIRTTKKKPNGSVVNIKEYTYAN